jgi:phytoene desaturase
MSEKIYIIGAGMGGVAAALRLAHLGYDVNVFEKNPRPGGRASLIEENGFRVDPGPTILVMKDIFDDTYRAVGENLDERVPFIQLDPNYRIYFHDRTHVDLFASMPKIAAELDRVEPGAGERLFQFLGQNALKHELGMAFVDRNFDSLLDLMNFKAGARLLRTRAYQNIYRHAADYFRSDKLRKAFSFHSMFLGLSPFDAPSVYSMITYADLARGMFYPVGGLHRLVQDMVSLAETRGASFRYNAPVKKIVVENGHVAGLQLESGEVIPGRAVISNADLPYTYTDLIGGQVPRRYSDRRLAGMDYACSGYLLYLGLNRTYPDMRHQALYFAEDYQANLDAIFTDDTLPEDPSFHLNNPTLTDPSVAPEGHSLLYLLAPMPNLKADIDWETASAHVREGLIGKLETILDPEIRAHIVWQREFTPKDFQENYNAVLGTAFGSLSHKLFQSAYFRPHNVARDIPGLYFSGQGTYPGIGMPMVLLSAKLVTERIQKEGLR